MLNAIKRKVGLLRQLVEMSAAVRDWSGNDDDAWSVCTIVSHELAREQIARQEQQHEL